MQQLKKKLSSIAGPISFRFSQTSNIAFVLQPKPYSDLLKSWNKLFTPVCIHFQVVTLKISFISLLFRAKCNGFAFFEKYIMAFETPVVFAHSPTIIFYLKLHFGRQARYS